MQRRAGGEDVTLYASDVRVAPVTSQPSSGQVAIVNRCEVRVASERGTVNVTSAKETTTVQQGQATHAFSEFGIQYRDSWKPIPADYPDLDPKSQYHKSHSHGACPAAPNQTRTAPTPPIHGRFVQAAVVLGGVALCIELCRAFESSEKPAN